MKKNNIKIILASELKIDFKPEMGRIFAEGFYQWLRFFSKDKEKLSKAFAHIFNPDSFFVAVIEDTVVGMGACSDGVVSSVRLNKKEMKKHLGFIMGTISYRILKKEFEEKKYPFPIIKDMGAVEFVAVSSKHRRQGIAKSIIEHIIENTPYTSYVLEVADTNCKAIALYESLGFKEFLRLKQKHSKSSGVNFLLYMKHDKKN